MECKFCKKDIKNAKWNQKYCCAKCSRANWSKNNLEKFKEYNKKSRQKKFVICRNCGNSISHEMRASGVTLCSDNCRSKRKKELDVIIRKKLFEEFREIKCKYGCCLCGYKKYGGSLDFHHKDPKEKDKRIDPKNWQNQKNEISKCILVCKNCHYELHHLMKQNISQYFALIENKTIEFER